MTLEACRPAEGPSAPAKLGVIFIDSCGARSKPAGGFLGRRFDDVITLWGRAPLTCPVFPGGAATLHWGLDDPIEVEGTLEERAAAFDRVLTEVSGRIRRFVPIALAQAAR